MFLRKVYIDISKSPMIKIDGNNVISSINLPESLSRYFLFPFYKRNSYNLQVPLGVGYICDHNFC